MPRPLQTLTFNKDLAPIVFDRCGYCHRPGQAAPFALLSYADVKKRGTLIAQVTARRYMPPWHAASAPGFPDFRDDRRLSDLHELRTGLSAVFEKAKSAIHNGDEARLCRLINTSDAAGQ